VETRPTITLGARPPDGLEFQSTPTLQNAKERKKKPLHHPHPKFDSTTTSLYSLQKLQVIVVHKKWFSKTIH